MTGSVMEFSKRSNNCLSLKPGLFGFISLECMEKFSGRGCHYPDMNLMNGVWGRMFQYDNVFCWKSFSFELDSFIARNSIQPPMTQTLILYHSSIFSFLTYMVMLIPKIYLLRCLAW